VKLAILEYIEKILTEVIEKLTGNTISKECKLLGVFDPYNTEWDFHVLIRVNQTNPVKAWQDYLEITRAYFELARENPLGLEGNPSEVFNASKSKTEIYYTIEQMSQIYGLSGVKWRE
jgi:hypothetical protein